MFVKQDPDESIQRLVNSAELCFQKGWGLYVKLLSQACKKGRLCASDVSKANQPMLAICFCTKNLATSVKYTEWFMALVYFFSGLELDSVSPYLGPGRDLIQLLKVFV